MQRTTLICLLVVLICAPVGASQPSVFEAVMQHDEPIRLALLTDSTDGVAAHGRAIVSR